MTLIEALALVIVVLTGLYLLALGAASLVVPARASRFLLGFAGSPTAHYTELLLRLVVGAAFVLYSPRMALSGAVQFFGWILLGTTACLLFVPWRWHHRFAQRTVPLAIRHLTLVGLASLAMGGLVLAAVALGDAA